MAKHRLPKDVAQRLKKPGRDKVLTTVMGDCGRWWGWSCCGDTYFIRRWRGIDPWCC
ncbi:hypothetical protein 7S3_61 [uncultured Caudovirales phage]|uniref:Uncharacterized protein n=1 Tax=uncultured Caudovirales phage TaxID=2100421 RepID=A0A2H4J3X7_9CAUD|nr:hypothetical protein 7S3_61 [uncultured Caudovirales phage]